ncbi:hypothetical protein K1719_019045 [Acacia pycnantha]|nr:hypothetical protein K1719_019045 [Acacia pycnantha]
MCNQSSQIEANLDDDTECRFSEVSAKAQNTTQARQRKKPLIIEYVDERDVTYKCQICGAKMWFNEKCVV